MSRRALNVLELWPTMGYLHEFIGCQTKQSLVYDLQEPFRWLADISIIEAFESGVLDMPDFYFTGDDYRYHFGSGAKQRLIDLLRERFNQGVRYKRRILRWDTVIEQKATELGRFLVGRTVRLSFVEPAPILETSDSQELRTTILGLTHSQAREVGIGKSTLHYLRKNADGHRSFKLYERVRRKLEASRSVPVE